MDTYAWADREINACPKYEMGFEMLLAAKPYLISSTARDQFDKRLLLIRSFQKTALKLFRAALYDEMDPTVLHWLINEIPENHGLAYHRSFGDRHFTLTVFFRTDEVRPGKIVEINCPAAGWGELQFVFEHMPRMGYCSGGASPVDQFTAQLTALLQGPPIVHPFLDRATSPGNWRFFIYKTRPRVRYWGIDRGVRADDCDFIRYQTFDDVSGG